MTKVNKHVGGWDAGLTLLTLSGVGYVPVEEPPVDAAVNEHAGLKDPEAAERVVCAGDGQRARS